MAHVAHHSLPPAHLQHSLHKQRHLHRLQRNLHNLSTHSASPAALTAHSAQFSTASSTRRTPCTQSTPSNRGFRKLHPTRQRRNKIVDVSALYLFALSKKLISPGSSIRVCTLTPSLDQRTEQKALSTLDKLSKGPAALGETYDQAIKQIDGQLTEEGSLASALHPGQLMRRDSSRRKTVPRAGHRAG